MSEGTGLSERPAIRGGSPPVAERPAPAGWALVVRFGAVAFFTVALFAGYLRMSRSRAVNADGASNALQAWDMLHGNVLLHGWTMSDVSFYTTELIQYALIEIGYGLQRDVVNVAAAMTYTMLVLLAAAVAKGRATGREGLLRAGIAVAIMLVPNPDHGYTLLLLSPDHIGTAVPLLTTWLVLDRLLTRPGGPPRWLPYLIAVLLTWAQVGDPLALFIGALPLVTVSGWRMWRARTRRGLDARLLLAGLASVALTQAVLIAVRLAGGFSLHPPIAQFAPPGRLWHHVVLTVKSLALSFGAYFPLWDGPLGWIGAALNLVGLLAALAAVGIAVAVLLRRPAAEPGDRVADVVATAIVVNLAAFVVSTQPGDLLTARQIVAVLPMGAALAGRILAGRVLPVRVRRPALRALAGVLVVLGVVFTAHAAAARPVPAEAQDAAEWLQAQGHTYGIGSYWAANTTTLYTRGRVRVAPVTGLRNRIYGYRWESHVDWYDPARHDARFLVLDLKGAAYGTVDAAHEQFGPPVERRDFGRFTVLRYEKNLLVGLPALCDPHRAPSMAQCPNLVPRLPGSTLFTK